MFSIPPYQIIYLLLSDSFGTVEMSALPVVIYEEEFKIV